MAYRGTIIIRTINPDHEPDLDNLHSVSGANLEFLGTGTSESWYGGKFGYNLYTASVILDNVDEAVSMLRNVHAAVAGVDELTSDGVIIVVSADYDDAVRIVVHEDGVVETHNAHSLKTMVTPVFSEDGLLGMDDNISAVDMGDEYIVCDPGKSY